MISVTTRTGKLVHLESSSDSRGTWTLCGRYVPDTTEAFTEVNCQKCARKRDLEEGLKTHRLSITHGQRLHLESIGSCSCGRWQPISIGGQGSGVAVVKAHEEHVLWAVRASR